MSQKPDLGSQIAPKNSPAVLIVVGGLLVGLVVVLLLVALRTKEGGGLRFPSDRSGNGSKIAAAARKLDLKQFGSKEIQKWIAEKMKSSGSKVGVVNIWATWCEPCRDEMPELAKFQKEGTAPLFLISADNEIDEPIVRTFLSEKGVDFESSLIKGDQQEFIENWQKLSSQDPARQWSMSLPATFLVDPSGQVMSFAVGTTTATELTALVKKTLLR